MRRRLTNFRDTDNEESFLWNSSTSEDQTFFDPRKSRRNYFKVRKKKRNGPYEDPATGETSNAFGRNKQTGTTSQHGHHREDVNDISRNLDLFHLDEDKTIARAGRRKKNRKKNNEGGHNCEPDDDELHVSPYRDANSSVLHGQIADPQRFRWADQDKKHIIDNDFGEMYQYNFVLPHRAVATGDLIQYRENGKVVQEDLLSNMNKNGICTVYDPAMRFDRRTRTFSDPYTGRKYTKTFVAGDWKEENQKVDPRKNAREQKAQKLESLQRHVRLKEEYQKTNIPMDARWLFCYFNVAGHCSFIVDEWLQRIGRGRHILDSCPHERDVLRASNAERTRYKSLPVEAEDFILKYAHFGYFVYKALEKKRHEKLKLFPDKTKYERYLWKLFREDGAYFLTFWWNENDHNGKMITNGHAAGFIVKKPYGFFMEPNAGCVICYKKSDLIDVCSRFMMESIKGDWSSLLEIAILQSHIRFDRLLDVPSH